MFGTRPHVSKGESCRTSIIGPVRQVRAKTYEDSYLRTQCVSVAVSLHNILEKSIVSRCFVLLFWSTEEDVQGIRNSTYLLLMSWN